jgi:hypothetical protein
MSIPAKCTSCGRAHRAPDALAGLKFKCKGCGKPVAVPDSAVPRTASKRSAKQPVPADVGDDFDDADSGLIAVPVLPRRTIREVQEKKSAPVVPTPTFSSDMTLEERIAARTAESAKRETGTAPIKAIVAGVALLIFGAISLGIELVSRFYYQRMGITIGGIGLYAVFFAAGFLVLIIAMVMWQMMPREEE